MKRIVSIDHINLLVTVEVNEADLPKFQTDIFFVTKGGIRLSELTEILEREGLSLYNIGTY